MKYSKQKSKSTSLASLIFALSACSETSPITSQDNAQLMADFSVAAQLMYDLTDPSTQDGIVQYDITANIANLDGQSPVAEKSLVAVLQNLSSVLSDIGINERLSTSDNSTYNTQAVSTLEHYRESFAVRDESDEQSPIFSRVDMPYPTVITNTDDLQQNGLQTDISWTTNSATNPQSVSILIDQTTGCSLSSGQLPYAAVNVTPVIDTTDGYITASLEQSLESLMSNANVVLDVNQNCEMIVELILNNSEDVNEAYASGNINSTYRAVYVFGYQS